MVGGNKRDGDEKVWMTWLVVVAVMRKMASDEGKG
jgi:hypothetical protein